MMENRGGVDGVDGDGPNRDGAATGVGARAMASATTRATHPLLSELRANDCPTAVRRRGGAEHMQVLRDADVAWRVHHGGGAATRRIQHTLCVAGDGSWQAAAATTAPTDHNAGC